MGLLGLVLSDDRSKVPRLTQLGGLEELDIEDGP
jgi:hypothetical protein